MNSSDFADQDEGPGRVKLAAVAKAANVSLATASKVVNGRVGVGAATRSRVESTIAELGYLTPGVRGPASLPQAGPALLEIIVDSLRNNSYAASVISGILEGAEPLGMSVITRPLAAVQAQDPQIWARALAESGRAGVIEITSDFSAARQRALRETNLPMVLIDPINPPPADVISIGATNWSGGVSATEHLLALGHRKIQYIGGPSGAVCDQARAHGFLAAMRTAGLNANLDHVLHGPFSYGHGLKAGTKILQAADRPTAIFAGSDVTALGLIEAARRLNLRVPHDLSIVGFDNTFLASTSSPPLTTVNQPLAEMGRGAVRLVSRMLAGEVPDTPRFELATHLVIRDSTAEPQ